MLCFLLWFILIQMANAMSVCESVRENYSYCFLLYVDFYKVMLSFRGRVTACTENHYIYEMSP